MYYCNKRSAILFCTTCIFFLSCMFFIKALSSSQVRLHSTASGIQYSDKIVPQLTDQRNALSIALNEMKKLYGQQNCKMQELTNGSNTVSQFGGWCEKTSQITGKQHVTDQNFAIALSKFLKNKTVVSFGDGPGEYKKLLNSFNEVINYTAFDGAPFCEDVTQGQVKFMDLTAPQYGIPIYDWAISIEVAEHIPEQFEDIYLGNLVRHAREGIILSWAVPGQGGLSHVNNKPLTYVIREMAKRGFTINEEAGNVLRQSSAFAWLRKNVHVYYRTNFELIHELFA